MKKNTKKYGLEIIVDIHDCNIAKFKRKTLDEFFAKLVKLSKMQAVGKPKYWLEHSNEPHLKGYSGIQFIKTSSILIHTLDILKCAYLNFFSCKDFDTIEVAKFIKDYFEAGKISYKVINRI
jgi:S-adenosylmethionine/arginine decarboxylase-like enzyme